MASLNKPSFFPKLKTHEGAPARTITPKQELRRTVMSCMLWEDTFYESGVSITDRIKELVPKVQPEDVGAMALEAREQMNLRHVPLLLAREMLRHPEHKQLVAQTLELIIQRPDELTEFMALYRATGGRSVPAQVKKGLGRAFCKFSEYQLAKYNGSGPWTLRDVMFLCHPKPESLEQARMWKRLANNELETPDTWEVALSAGADKAKTFTRLILEGKLGGLALLRNLRNMVQSGVDEQLIRQAILAMNTDRILPFRFISAARHAPQFEPELEVAMCRSCPRTLRGTTFMLVDVSGSMTAPLSTKSEVTGMDAACGLAMILAEMGESLQTWSFSCHTRLIPPRRGFALRDAILQSQPAAATLLGSALLWLGTTPRDRLIVITDEQCQDKPIWPTKLSPVYVINVAPCRTGVGYGQNLVHIDGWSESVLNYIQQYEAEGL